MQEILGKPQFICDIAITAHFLGYRCRKIVQLWQFLSLSFLSPLSLPYTKKSLLDPLWSWFWFSAVTFCLSVALHNPEYCTWIALWLCPKAQRNVFPSCCQMQFLKGRSHLSHFTSIILIIFTSLQNSVIKFALKIKFLALIIKLSYFALWKKACNQYALS